MKQWLMLALLPLAVGAAWTWAIGDAAKMALAGRIVDGILWLEALAVSKWPALASKRPEANKAIEAELREVADELQKKEDEKPS